jgi:lipid-A-disaccharide synthase
MQASRPSLKFVLPAAPGWHDRLKSLIDRHAPDAGILVLEGRSHEALAACDATLIASGTATLEAALFKRPMVISYRMPALSAWIMRRKGYIPYVGLPNIMANEFVVPELLQEAATPDALARAVLDLLADPGHRARLAARFTEMHHALKRDTAQLAADAILAEANR